MNAVNKTENTRMEKEKGDAALEEADYYPEITFSEKIAKERLQDAKRFIKKIKSCL